MVAADGRYAGYVSGGCVEAAIATEALCAINDGKDKLVTFGKDSSFKDIVLPCGGSITVSIHILKDVASLRQSLTRLSERHPAAISYHPTHETLTQSEPTGDVGWKDGAFVNVYHPPTRTVVSGGSFEVARLAALLKAAEMETVTVVDRFQTSDLKQKIDDYTAIVLMHHDLDKEIDLLEVATYAATPTPAGTGIHRYSDRPDKSADRGIRCGSRYDDPCNIGSCRYCDGACQCAVDRNRRLSLSSCRLSLPP